MTRITAKTDEYGLKPIRVNGRYIKLAQRIDDISAVSAGRWEGTASGEKFEIIGGRASGGASNEWFVKFPLGFGDQHIAMNSAAACIRAIESV